MSGLQGITAPAAVMVNRPGKSSPAGLSQVSLLVTAIALVPLAFHPDSPEPFQFYKTWLLTLCALGVAAIGLCTNWLQRPAWSGWPEGGVMLALIGWAALSGAWATNAYFTWQDLPLLAAPVMLSVAARAALRSPQRRIAICLSGAVAGTIVASVAIAEVFGSYLVFREGGKILALFGYQNLVAQFVICSLSLTIGLAIQAPRRWARILLLLSIAAQAVALLATMCRGAWLGLLVGWSAVGILLIRSRARPQRWRFRAVLPIIVGAALLALAAITGLALWGRASPAFGEALQVRFWGLFSRGASGRFPIWRATAALWLDHPFIGVGFGNFPIEYPRYCEDNWEFVRYAHNDFLQYTAELGIPGGLLLLLLLVTVLRRGSSLLSGANSQRERALIGAFMAVILGTATDALVSYDFYQPAPAACCYVAIGALGAYSMKLPQHRRSWLAAACGGLLAVALVFAGFSYLRGSWLAKVHYDGWMTAQSRGDRQLALAHLRAGEEVSPRDPRFHYFEGLMAYEARDLDRARNVLETAQKLSPYVWQVHHHLAMIALLQDRVERAEAEAARAMRLRKNSRELLVTWNLIQQRKARGTTRPAATPGAHSAASNGG